MRHAEDIKSRAKNKFSWRIFWENFVFKHEEHYYKMPTFLAKNVMYRNSDSYEKVVEAMCIIKKYFWPLTLIPKTEVFREKSGHYVLKQENIAWEKITKKLLESNPKLLSKFRRLIIANEIMWQKEGVFLDLLWSDIITHPKTIHNLLTDWENIYVFDFWLLEKSSKNIFFKNFSRIGTWIQLKFIKIFF